MFGRSRANLGSLGRGAALLLVLFMGVAMLPNQVSAQDATPPATTFPTTARFLNAMTASFAIDISLNGDDNRVVEGLEYGQVSEPVELTVPVSEIIVKQPKDLQFDQWIFDTVMPTTAGQTYVIVISDFLVIPVAVDTSTFEGKNFARARVVHAASQSPAVDMYIGDNASPSLINLRYGYATDTGVVVDGTYDVRFDATGTTTPVLAVPGVVLTAGQAYVMVLIGKPNSTDAPLTLVAVATAAAVA